MTAGIYTIKWFLQCFIDRVSIFSLFSPQLYEKNMNCMDVPSPDRLVPDVWTHSASSLAFPFEHRTAFEVVLSFSLIRLTLAAVCLT